MISEVILKVGSSSNPTRHVLFALAGAFLLATLLSGPTGASGLPDADQPATIESDRAEMDRSTGIAIYIGNAEFNQGTLRITGDRIEVHTVDGELRYAESTGDLATGRQQTEEGDWIDAEAEKITYEPDTPLITLTRRARLTREGDVFTAAFIQYRPDTGWVEAERDERERVYITIQPREDRDEE